MKNLLEVVSRQSMKLANIIDCYGDNACYKYYVDDSFNGGICDIRKIYECDQNTDENKIVVLGDITVLLKEIANSSMYSVEEPTGLIDLSISNYAETLDIIKEKEFILGMLEYVENFQKEYSITFEEARLMDNYSFKCRGSKSFIKDLISLEEIPSDFTNNILYDVTFGNLSITLVLEDDMSVTANVYALTDKLDIIFGGKEYEQHDSDFELKKEMLVTGFDIEKELFNSMIELAEKKGLKWSKAN